MAKTALYLILGLLACPALAQAPRGELACKSTGTDFVYDCTIRLSRAGKPLEGVKVTVGADMPSMPMAHNVRPVSASAIRGEPGVYGFRLNLEMQGEWALKIGINKPFRDLVIRVLEFGPNQVQPKR